MKSHKSFEIDQENYCLNSFEDNFIESKKSLKSETLLNHFDNKLVNQLVPSTEIHSEEGINQIKGYLYMF